MPSAVSRNGLTIANNNMTMNGRHGGGTENTRTRRHVRSGARVEKPVAAVVVVVERHVVESGVETGWQRGRSAGVEGGIRRW